MPGDTTGIGVGLVVQSFKNNVLQTTTKNTDNIGKEQLVYNGELKGVTQAIELASLIAKPGQTYDIYSDNQAGIY